MLASEATEEESTEVELTFEDLISPENELKRALPEADAYNEHKYRLTAAGKAKMQRLLAGGEYQPVAEGIRRIKSKYGRYSLKDLLYQVYTRYPEMTTESEIKEKVLRRRQKR